MAKLHATVTNEKGATISKSAKETLKIDIKVGNRLWETLTVKFEEDIVEAMNYEQGTDGYTLTTDYGKRLSYILASKSK